MEMIAQNPYTPKVTMSNQLSGCSINFNVDAYTDFLRRFVPDKNDVGRLEIRFDTTLRNESQHDSVSKFLTFGDFNAEDKKIRLYIDALAMSYGDDDRFSEECQKTLIHETGHYVDNLNGGLGLWGRVDYIEAVAELGVVVAGVAGLATVCKETLKKRRTGEIRSKAAIAGTALGLGSSALIYWLIEHAPCTEAYYNYFDVNERFARAFEDYHDASFLDVSHLN